MSATVVAALVLSGFCLCADSRPQEIRWLSYEPTVVELVGKLVVEQHYGPPGFGENPDSDQKAIVPVLVLRQPVSVRGDPHSDLNTQSVEGISRIQLVFNTSSPSHKKLIGSTVLVRGTLFRAHTGHHYTDVLLTVQKIRKQPSPSDISQSNDELTVLKNALSQTAISNFVVLRMADEIMTRTSVSPRALRNYGPPMRKYTIEMTDSRAATLLDWINRATFTPRKYSPDCRWGLLFIDKDGTEVASLFSDKFGLAVTVDGHDLNLSDRSLLDTIHGLVGSQVH